jgi:V-type H+-transporting ATPase subunit G
LLTGKARRIKQAREEAQAEIENYRRERERQFREYEAKYMGSREDIAAKIDKNTELMLCDVESDVKNNKEKVLADLLYLVLNVKPEVHPNYKIMRVFGKI